jgi:G3E family GTPase
MGTKASIIVLVDAGRWCRVKKPLHKLLAGQIHSSDRVLLNKTDLVSPEQLALVESDILGIEPGAVILKISALKGVSDDVWEKVAEEKQV